MPDPIALADITGLVLAGGQGSRMGGVDKGLQPFRGQPLALHALQRLAPQVGALPLSDVERGQLNAVLNKAFSRLTFDPMHSAWESLTDVLKRGR